MVVMLEDARSGDRQPLVVGWSWSFFLFSPMLGIPLFFKGLTAWGGVMVVLWAMKFALPLFLPMSDYFNYLVVAPLALVAGLTIYLACFGNAMVGRKYLARGYRFARPSSLEARVAAERWGVAG